jgi:transcription antitermination factor NusG
LVKKAVENRNETELGTQLAERRPAEANESPSWYAVQIRYRFEKKAAEQFQAKGIETFLPLRTELHRWSDRDKEIRVPLFPGYAFVRIAQSKSWRLRLLSTTGVIGFVDFQGEAPSIPQNQIEQLQLLLSRKVPCSMHPFLHVGQKVRIRGGCLHGLEGILSENDTRHLVISIESIQRSIAIEIEGYELEPV